MKDILVFLDLSKMDKVLLRYTLHLRNKFRIGKICLVHFVQIQELGNLNEYFDLEDQSLDEIIEEEIRSKAEKDGLESDDYEVQLFLKGGFDAMLEWINESDYDICLLGKKIIHGGTGAFPGKLVRLTKKSVLMITESTRLNLETLLIPVDFSDYSKKALDFAGQLTPREIDFKLIAINVFRVPQTYFPYLGEWDQKHIEKMRSGRQKKLKEFISDVDFSRDTPETEVAYGEKSISDTIYNYAVSNFVDLIILSVKGKNNASNLQIGTVPYQLIQPQKEVAVLLVR
ncbi:MAG: universal stress protein [Cyclobacteriaceae bacterium]